MTHRKPRLKIHAHNYLRRWRHLEDYLKILLAYIFFVAVMSAAGIYAFHNLTLEPNYGSINTIPQDWFNVFMRWDGIHYTNIAIGGYGVYSPSNYAFFPLFPLLIHGVSSIISQVSPFIIASVIPRIAFLISLFLLYRLFQSKFDKTIGLRTVLALLFFPASFFFIAPYTESIFLLLALSTFLACRKQHWHVASICAMFAGSLKLLGCMLFIVVFIEYLRYYQCLRWNFLWLMLMPLGLVGYMLYLANTVGDPLYFATCEADFERFVTLPFIPLWITIKNFMANFGSMPLGELLTSGNLFLEICISITIITLIVIAFRKLDIKYALYCLLLFIVPFSTEVDVQGLCGMARYSIILFPLFNLLAKGFKHKWFAVLYCTVGAVVNIHMMCKFATWFFVA